MKKLTAKRATAKQDDLSPAHLEWLVESRTAHQRAALKLYKLLDQHGPRLKEKELSQKTQLLMAACFSLWRAAFLADKTGVRQAVLEDAQNFLGKILANNAINYAEDRSAREWTFNYYMNNAKDSLMHLAKTCDDIRKVISAHRKVTKGTTNTQRRWRRYQAAFETAIDHFATALRK